MNRRFLIFFLIIVGCVIPRNGISQPTSFLFEFKADPLYFPNPKVLETNDDGFLVSHLDVVYKLDRFGKTQWTYHIKKGKGFQPHPEHNLDAAFRLLGVDEDGIYLTGSAFQGTYSYYAKLSHSGTLDFDTVFYHWNEEENPLHNFSRSYFDGESIVYVGSFYDNLEERDSLSPKWVWDKMCYSLFRFDKNNAKRLSSHYHCVSSDSSQFPQGIIRLNTPDKGYLILMKYGVGPFYSSSSYKHDVIVRTDSIGKVLSIKDLFEYEFFSDFLLNTNHPKTYDFYQEGFETKSIYQNLRNYDLTNGITIKIRGEQSDGIRYVSGVWFVSYDSEGNYLKKVKTDTMDRYGINEISFDLFVFRNEDGSYRWQKEFPRPENTYFQVDYFRTSKDGLIIIYKHNRPEPDDYTTPYQFYIQHINHEGWGLNVPRVVISEDLSNPWFDAQGALVLPEGLEDWNWSLMDITGKQISKSRNLATGVYIVQLRNPKTGEMRNWKVFKE